MFGEKSNDTGYSIWNAALTTTHELLQAQYDETNDNIEFLQPYPVVSANALFEIGTAIISAVFSLDEHFPQTNTSCISKFFFTSHCIVLISTSLSGYNSKGWGKDLRKEDALYIEKKKMLYIY
jgi:hypothetical protein